MRFMNSADLCEGLGQCGNAAQYVDDAEHQVLYKKCAYTLVTCYS